MTRDVPGWITPRQSLASLAHVAAAFLGLRCVPHDHWGRHCPACTEGAPA